MAKCEECGARYNKADACNEYESYFDHEMPYDSDVEDMCASCAIAESESLMNIGKAIDMMNGEEDYDNDFVERYL